MRNLRKVVSAVLLVAGLGIVGLWCLVFKPGSSMGLGAVIQLWVATGVYGVLLWAAVLASDFRVRTKLAFSLALVAVATCPYWFSAASHLQYEVRRRLNIIAQVAEETRRRHGEPLRFPFNPFAAACAGDWEEMELGRRRIRFEIAQVNDTTVTLSVTRTGGGSAMSFVLPRDQAPSFVDLFRWAGCQSTLDAIWEVQEQPSRSANVAGTRFTGAGLRFQHGFERRAVTAGFSSQVKGIGLVECHDLSAFFGERLELLRFGSRDGPIWSRLDDAFPIEPHGNYQYGDWTALTVTSRARDGSERIARQVYEVDSGPCKKVRIRERGEPLREFELGCEGRLTWKEFVQDPEERQIVSLGDFRNTTETLSVSGRAFACQKLSFTGKDAAGSTRRVSLWVSSDVKGVRLVKAVDEGGEPSRSYDLLGYGSAVRTEWGTNPIR